MLDMNQIRENLEVVKESMRRRNMDSNAVDKVITLDAQWREVLTEGNGDDIH